MQYKQIFDFYVWNFVFGMARIVLFVVRNCFWYLQVYGTVRRFLIRGVLFLSVSWELCLQILVSIHSFTYATHKVKVKVKFSHAMKTYWGVDV
jgi:hypothetical protein